MYGIFDLQLNRFRSGVFYDSIQEAFDIFGRQLINRWLIENNGTHLDTSDEVYMKLLNEYGYEIRKVRSNIA
jgi:hypothetical protein